MTIERRLERQEREAEALAARVRDWLAPTTGAERALDVGTGTGALALAFAPLVHEVIGVDHDEELIEAARRLAPANVTFEIGDVSRLPFERASFDLAGCADPPPRAAPRASSSPSCRASSAPADASCSSTRSPRDPIAALELDHSSASATRCTPTLPDGDVRGSST